MWQISETDKEEIDIYEGVFCNLYAKDIFVVSIGNEDENSLVCVGTNSEFGNPRNNYIETIIDGIEVFKSVKDCLDKIQSWDGFY